MQADLFVERFIGFMNPIVDFRGHAIIAFDKFTLYKTGYDKVYMRVNNHYQRTFPKTIPF